ncbi:NAD(+) kinase [Neonectria ditissima]|uniref:NAD(+) kinase n=1 Tax=Neonectria ditissima TaxID=78410 RepID=A0A0N8H8T3_9HYPO|nr:NAD(+) kinase [Neonectria ditissima]
MTGVLRASSPTALHPTLGSPRRDREGSPLSIKSAPVAERDGVLLVDLPAAATSSSSSLLTTTATNDNTLTPTTTTTTTTTSSPSPSHNSQDNVADNSSTLPDPELLLPSSSSATFSVVAAAEDAIDPIPGLPLRRSAPTAGASFGGSSSPSLLVSPSTIPSTTPLEAPASSSVGTSPGRLQSPSLSVITPSTSSSSSSSSSPLESEAAITTTTLVSSTPSPSFPSSASASASASASFHHQQQSGHRRNTPSRDSIPRQTVIKALASVARQRKPDALSLVAPSHSNSHSHSRVAGGSSHARTGSQSRSLSLLYGMYSAQGGDGESLSESLSEALSKARSPTTGAGTDAGTSTSTSDPSSQTLTDALNDIAKSRMAPAPPTPTATTPIPTPTTAVRSAPANSSHFNVASPAATAANANADSTSAISTAAALSSAAAAATPTPATALFPSSLQSPCFYHERFADAVDIGKVLEEIKNDVSMSHSRLVATATGVREVSKQLQRRPVKRAVRNIMIVTKARDNQLVYLTRELASWLLRTPRYGSDLGVNVYVDAKLRGSRRFDAPAILAENPRFQHMLKYWTPDLCWSQPEKFDLVLTLGGDGTVLFTSWLFQRIVPPVLSFSLGSLGFMTTFEFEKYKEHLNRVMGDDGMKINLRMRFTCTVYRGGLLGGPTLEEGEQFEVLNELVIDRGPSPYVSNLELYGDDELLTVVQADGCIFSTPTGSTAYSLSAGGALVHPDIPAILLTPICPHTLSFRPMVLSDTMALRVTIPRNSRATAYCAFDGKGRLELRQGDHVTITASQYPFPTVTRTDTEWFDSVSRTLRWNVRAAAQKPFDADAASPNDDDQEDLSWDIDTDSAFYGSEEGSVSASPIRRQMSLLGL